MPTTGRLEWRKALVAIGWSLLLTILIIMLWPMFCAAKPLHPFTVHTDIDNGLALSNRNVDFLHENSLRMPEVNAVIRAIEPTTISSVDMDGNAMTMTKQQHQSKLRLNMEQRIGSAVKLQKREKKPNAMNPVTVNVDASIRAPFPNRRIVRRRNSKQSRSNAMQNITEKMPKSNVSSDNGDAVSLHTIVAQRSMNVASTENSSSTMPVKDLNLDAAAQIKIEEKKFSMYDTMQTTAKVELNDDRKKALTAASVAETSNSNDTHELVNANNAIDANVAVAEPSSYATTTQTAEIAAANTFFSTLLPTSLPLTTTLQTTIHQPTKTRSSTSLSSTSPASSASASPATTTTIQSVFLEYLNNFNGTDLRHIDNNINRSSSYSSSSGDDRNSDFINEQTSNHHDYRHEEAILSRTERSVHDLSNIVLDTSSSKTSSNRRKKSSQRNDTTSNVDRMERSANLSLSKSTKRIQILIKSRLLQLLPDGTVNGTQDDESEYTILQRGTVDVGQIRLIGIATCLYLCMDACGNLYSSRQFTNDCIFNERLEDNYNYYTSTHHSTALRTFYMALNRLGVPRKTNLPANKPLGKLSTYVKSFTLTVPEQRSEAIIGRLFGINHVKHGIKHLCDSGKELMPLTTKTQFNYPKCSGSSSSSSSNSSSRSASTSNNNNSNRSVSATSSGSISSSNNKKQPNHNIRHANGNHRRVAPAAMIERSHHKRISTNSAGVGGVGNGGNAKVSNCTPEQCPKRKKLISGNRNAGTGSDESSKHRQKAKKNVKKTHHKNAKNRNSKKNALASTTAPITATLTKTTTATTTTSTTSTTTTTTTESSISLSLKRSSTVDGTLTENYDDNNDDDDDDDLDDSSVSMPIPTNGHTALASDEDYEIDR